MFDFHMHSTVSCDGHDAPEKMVAAARKMGLKEICFTDHVDDDPRRDSPDLQYTLAEYEAAYGNLTDDQVKLRFGMEFGLLDNNQALAAQRINERNYDFIIGSVHYADNIDIYFPAFWEGRTVLDAEQSYMQFTLDCVTAHTEFDVLGHLTYPSKAKVHPTHIPIDLNTHKEIIAEIFKVLIAKGKGIEINTSGVDRCNAYLPSPDYLRLFKDLGGNIVTVGSDAHTVGRVGQYCREACQIVQDIFGHVCTFENRQPIFHKL